MSKGKNDSAALERMPRWRLRQIKRAKARLERHQVKEEKPLFPLILFVILPIYTFFKYQDENCLFMNIYVPIRGEEEARRAEEEGEKGKFCWQKKGGVKLGNPESYSESRK